MIINPYVFVGVSPGSYDTDAVLYIDRVETADDQALEPPVKDAINQLFLTVKEVHTYRAEDITLWQRMRQTLPLIGARTLAGAMIPLQSTEVEATAVGLGAGDYDRKTGVKGDPGRVTYIQTTYQNQRDSRTSASHAVDVTEVASGSSLQVYVDGSNSGTSRRRTITGGVDAVRFQSMASSTTTQVTAPQVPGLVGCSRYASGNVDLITPGGYIAGRGLASAFPDNTLLRLLVDRGSNNRSDGRIRHALFGGKLDLQVYKTAIDAYSAAINLAI